LGNLLAELRGIVAAWFAIDNRLRFNYRHMLIPFVVSLVVAGGVFVIGEYFRRRYGYSNEVSRKLVHAIHGLLVAIWPFFVGYKVVIAVEILFILSVLLAERLRLFGWLWRVGRKSWGQFLYPIGIIIAALTADSKWIYLAAALQLGLADAAAALVGKAYGAKSSYVVFGQKKSIHGSLAFFVVSCIILQGLLLSGHIAIGGSGLTMLAIAAVLTLVENAGVYGSDNLLIPVATVSLLNAFSQLTV
jgi:phytol kinase